MKPFQKPIRMRSIASDNAADVAEFMKAFPDADMVTDDPDHPQYGVPVAHNRKQKLAYLEFYDYAEKR